MTRKYNRRTFIEFLGKGTLGVIAVPSVLYGCVDEHEELKREINQTFRKKFDLLGIEPTEIDDLVLADGLNYAVMVSWGDAISSKDSFGFNNDFIQYIPIKGESDEALLWVNHEYISRRFVSGEVEFESLSRTDIEKEMYQVGGSIIKIQKKGKYWELVKDDASNKRVSGLTDIQFNWDEDIVGSRSAMGTIGNCSGGLTPWGNILTCEENYDGMYGETLYQDGVPSHVDSYLHWEKHFPENKPEHYGWVVEVNPHTGEAQKHVALGRCMHECAMLKQLDDGRLVVYSGDDANDRCLYKFIGDEPNSLKKGTLYVANLEKGIWESLDLESRVELQQVFNSQTEVLIRLREAAPLVGGSPLARPEDIEIDPITGDVLIALTNNYTKENYHGSILKISETEGYDGLKFTHEDHLTGGEEMGFSCPDNMVFDAVGNLWFTSDMSGSVMQAPPYTEFKNNGLFVVPRIGNKAGQVIQLASAPTHAEFTGPCFSADYKTLFLSVQHPGEYSESMSELSSHWPNGGNSIPRSSVVCIQGKALDAIVSGNI